MAGIILFAIITFISSAVLFANYINMSSQDTVITQSPVSIPFEQDLAQVQQSDLENHAETLNIDPDTTLSSAEISDLIYMREEEKLARDVYITLYNTWGLQIFNNISSSEQTHTDSIKTLLDNYSIEDPFINEIGKFSNPDLQALYTQLVNKGNVSVTEALTVGALIEDLDITDLDKTITRTENSSIISVDENLQRGSRNHIRSFTQTLSRYGVSYSPTYLTESEYLEIISGGTESGSGLGNKGGR